MPVSCFESVKLLGDEGGKGWTEQAVLLRPLQQSGREQVNVPGGRVHLGQLMPALQAQLGRGILLEGGREIRQPKVFPEIYLDQILGILKK